ncbi:MAG TPA: hypothetical protein VKI61_19830 [Chitinophagaceae bacterium]|nr:hypothetical protein [Chitinophagaceae bacterium]
MNTLNYKVLLIKTTFVVFVRALVIYLLISIPAVAEPFMYLTSAILAVSFGWVAAVVFLLLFYSIQKLNAGLIVKNTLLYTSVAIAVLAAFQMMEVTGVEERIWYSGLFLLFPTVAIIAGCISLAISKQKINQLFTLTESHYNEMTDKNILSMCEQQSFDKI